MPQISYQFPVNTSMGAEDIARSFLLAYPVDWWAQAAANGPLSIVVAFHGGGGNAAEMMGSNRLDVEAMYDDEAKCIVLSLQGVSMTGSGGSWNAGILGNGNRLAEVDDVSYVLDALDRANDLLTQWYADEFEGTKYDLGSGEATAGTVTSVIDKEKLHFVGFSQGAAMAYRMAYELTQISSAWELNAMCIVSGSSGGYYQYENVAGSPDVDWTPSGTDWDAKGQWSLLVIHGEDDPALVAFDANNDAMYSPNDRTRVKDETGFDADVPNTESYYYLEANFTGRYSANLCGTTATTEWGTKNPSPAGLTAMTGTYNHTSLGEWDANASGYDVAVYYYEKQGWEHAWPPELPSALLEFFRDWGAL